MKAIVAVDSRWGIGRAGKQLFYIPDDLAFFRRQTMGRLVIMGRATLAALPKGSPLPDRHNLVLTHNPASLPSGCEGFSSLQALACRISSCAQSEVFVIGGAQVYRLLLPYCGEALITHIQADGQADRFFPDLGNIAGWSLEKCSEVRTYKALNYRFSRYRNSAVQTLQEGVAGIERGPMR